MRCLSSIRALCLLRSNKPRRDYPRRLPRPLLLAESSHQVKSIGCLKQLAISSDEMETPCPSETVKTRIIILSDTHNQKPFDSSDTQHAFRSPLPEANVLLHAGDLTGSGKQYEHQRQVEMLSEHSAELKIVIPGNHDITFDEEYYASHPWKHHTPQDSSAIKKMYTGPEACEAGIVLMKEGIQSFKLKNGAKFTLYASAYQPEFCDLAFAYERDEDRFSPAPAVQSLSGQGAAHPIPSHPLIDIVMTHGPPFGILDNVVGGGPFMKTSVGCKHLLRAVKRCKPRLHVFGHIHEGWGAKRMKWALEEKPESQDDLISIVVGREEVFGRRGAYIDVSSDGGNQLKWGQETLFVNASIMDVWYNPRNAPWVVDLELPKG
jgi:Calcineurin-like phosphoesterase